MKRKLLAAIAFIFALIAGNSAQAQIIDDTTRVLYSPRTTLNLYEDDVLRGRYIEQRIDTSIKNMHNERHWYQDTSYYQHLGNISAAAQPLFFQMPRKIGARYGKNAFDRYAYRPDQLNYFNTRSPYSHLFYVQGGRGEQAFEGIYARNITERWNAGVAYRILSGNRQIGVPNSLRRDNVIYNQAVKAFTHYRSASERYDLFANYTFQRVEQVESGGIRPREGDIIPDSLFRFDGELTNLNQAASSESRHNYHLLHIYKLAGENLKLYHAFDWRIQANGYRDAALPRENENLIFYPGTEFSQTRTQDSTRYREIQNIVGVTGNNKVSFYKAYVMHRNSRIEYSAINTRMVLRNPGVPESAVDSLIGIEREQHSLNQLFVGGQFRLNYKDVASLLIDGEFQLTRDYRIGATAHFGAFEVSQARVLRSPSLVEEHMLSNHFVWNNDFNNIVTDRSTVSYGGNLGERQFLRLVGHYTNIKRHVFFNTSAVPQQLEGNQRFFSARLEHRIRFGAVHFENTLAYTNTSRAETIRMPEWLLDSKVYYQGALFRGALYGQFGVQMYLPTAYYADAYMPVTQQFYLQNEFQLQTYPVFDVFLTADIKSLNVFLKMAHVNEGLLDQPGYFATPYYPGMRRSFVFGIKWMFFD